MFKNVCKKCLTDFYPHWYGDTTEKEECPQCGNTEHEKKEVTKNQLLKELNDSVNKKYTKSGG